MNQGRRPGEQIFVRPAAGDSSRSYSSSNSVHCIEGADIVIRLTGQEFNRIHQANSQHIVTVGPSMRMGDLNQKAYQQYNVVPSTTSLNPYLSIGGLVATSGQGTGANQPSITGLIVGMDICLPSGELVHIDNRHPDFNTLRVHLGLLGVVVRMQVQCTPASKLQCEERNVSIATLVKGIEEKLFESAPYVSVFVNCPTVSSVEQKNQPSARIYRWHPVEKDHPDINARNWTNTAQEEIQARLLDGINIGRLFSNRPSLAPVFLDRFVKPATLGSKDGTSVSSWPTSMHHLRGYPYNVEDLGFLLHVGSNYAELSTAFQGVLGILEHYARRGIYPITYGMYLRCIQGTNGGLSTSQHAPGHRICSIDMASDPNAPGFRQFQEEVYLYLKRTLGAGNVRPHLGKVIPQGYTIDCPEFNAAIRRWYRHQGMELETSMLVTPHFNHLLNLSLYSAPQAEMKLRSKL